MSAKTLGHWYFSKSAVLTSKVKVPKGWESNGYFYQGASFHFGHPNDSKKGKGKKG